MKKSLLIAVLFLFLAPLVSASFIGPIIGYTPQDFFNSEWFRFVIVFFIFYALIFFATKKVFGEKNKTIGAIVAVGVSLFITSAFAQGGLLSGYLDTGVSGLLVLIGLFILFALLFRVFYTKVSKAGSFILLFALWLILFLTPPESIIPYFMLTNSVLQIYDVASSFFGLIILIGLGIIVVAFDKKKHKQLRISY
jgi:hypothetical protein